MFTISIFVTFLLTFSYFMHKSLSNVNKYTHTKPIIIKDHVISDQLLNGMLRHAENYFITPAQIDTDGRLVTRGHVTDTAALECHSQYKDTATISDIISRLVGVPSRHYISHISISRLFRPSATSNVPLFQPHHTHINQTSFSSFSATKCSHIASVYLHLSDIPSGGAIHYHFANDRMTVPVQKGRVVIVYTNHDHRFEESIVVRSTSTDTVKQGVDISAKFAVMSCKLPSSCVTENRVRDTDREELQPQPSVTHSPVEMKTLNEELQFLEEEIIVEDDTDSGEDIDDVDSDAYRCNNYTCNTNLIADDDISNDGWKSNNLSGIELLLTNVQSSYHYFS